MALEPIIDRYAALQVTFSFGTYYLHPGEEKELRTALEPYITLQHLTGYCHPFIKLRVVELNTSQIKEIAGLRFDTPLEEILTRITCTTEEVMDKLRNHFYNVRLNFKEIDAFSKKIKELEKKKEEEKESARKKLKQYKDNIISTSTAKYKETFIEGTEIISRELFGDEYPKLIMELALAVMAHKWYHMQDKDINKTNEEKEYFLITIVAPILMGINCN